MTATVKPGRYGCVHFFLMATETNDLANNRITQILYFNMLQVFFANCAREEGRKIYDSPQPTLHTYTPLIPK